MALAQPIRNPLRAAPPTFLAPCLSRHTLRGVSQRKSNNHSSERWASQTASAPSTKRIIPAPTPFCPDATTFLTLIGRQMSQHASKFDSWEALFGASSEKLKEIGIEPARNRRYLLWWRDQFRRGRFGIGGDLQHVEGGMGEVRIRSEDGGRRRVAVSVPLGSSRAEHVAEGSVVRDVQVEGPGLGVIRGSYFVPVKGSENRAARIQVAEGIWEVKRGRKIFGGERRRKNVLSRIAARARGTLT